MLPRPNPQAATATTMPDILRDEVDALQASCREISAQGGEIGEIANRILGASLARIMHQA